MLCYSTFERDGVLVSVHRQTSKLAISVCACVCVRAPKITLSLKSASFCFTNKSLLSTFPCHHVTWIASLNGGLLRMHWMSEGWFYSLGVSKKLTAPIGKETTMVHTSMLLWTRLRTFGLTQELVNFMSSGAAVSVWKSVSEKDGYVMSAVSLLFGWEAYHTWNAVLLHVQGHYFIWQNIFFK
jgi:hypothetical protein